MIIINRAVIFSLPINTEWHVINLDEKLEYHKFRTDKCAKSRLVTKFLWLIKQLREADSRIL